MKTLEFRCDGLKEVVALCKANSIKVYAFQRNEPIGQVIVVSENGQIGSVSESWGGLSYSTVHKGNRQCGTGFGLSGVFGCEPALIERIKDAMFTIKPDWAQNYTVEKYRDWNDYISKPINQILTYFEL